MKLRRQLNGESEEGRTTKRVRIFEDELEIVNNLRSLYNEAIELGQNPNDVKHGWIKNKEASLFIKNPNFEGQLDKQKEFRY